MILDLTHINAKKIAKRAGIDNHNHMMLGITSGFIFQYISHNHNDIIEEYIKLECTWRLVLLYLSLNKSYHDLTTKA